jgi:hypothetical protein
MCFPVLLIFHCCIYRLPAGDVLEHTLSNLLWIVLLWYIFARWRQSDAVGNLAPSVGPERRIKTW